jgi:hypothetical protein
MPSAQLEDWAAQLLARHDWNIVAQKAFAALQEAH